MKLLRVEQGGSIRPALLDGEEQIRDLSAVIEDVTPDVLSVQLDSLRGIDIESLPVLSGCYRIACPVGRVGKLVCVGLNYRDHAAESGMAIPEEPVVFMKATSAICGPNDDIVLPLEAHKTDWEVELGLVVGTEARYVALDQALECIAGLCVVNDLSDRGLQLERGGQWTKGKSCDTFAPVGPYLVTLDEVGDLSDLELWCDVNGERMQRGNTRDMIFDARQIVHYLSQYMSLQPGDIICTGTPAGVALGMPSPRWLQPGDVVTLGISGLGAQCQSVRRYQA